MELPIFYNQSDEWGKTLLLYDSALKELNTRLEIINNDFKLAHQYNPIEHITSRIKSSQSIAKKIRKLGMELTVENIDLGGGLGVDYEDPDGSPVPDFALWFRTISENLPLRPWQSVHVEPGRSVVAQCGTLISRVLFVKSGETKTFLILDAGMNDLIRPALYGAYHKIENLSALHRPGNFPVSAASSDAAEGLQAYDVVGPVCESSDVWGAGRLLPQSRRRDVMAIRSAGAYGQVMSSRYNLRDLAPAVYSDDLLPQEGEYPED